MDIRYHIDADTGLPHISNHGVTEAEVEQVLRGRGDDVPSTRNSRIKIGQTAAGRYLKVVYVPDDPGPDVFVVTAYDASKTAKKALRRKRRRRG